jgi:hypothetical protein
LDIALLVFGSLAIIVVICITTIAIFNEDKHKGRSGRYLLADIFADDVLSTVLFTGNRNDKSSLAHAIKIDCINFARELVPNDTITNEADARVVVGRTEDWQDSQVKRTFRVVVKHCVQSSLDKELISLTPTGDIQCWPQYNKSGSDKDAVVNFFTRLITLGTQEEVGHENENISKGTASKNESTQVKIAPKLQSLRSKSFLMTDDTKAGMEMEMTDLGIGATDARDIVGSFDQAEMTVNNMRSSLDVYTGNEAARQALVLIGDGYKRSISPDCLERKLSNILHSHFLFVRRGLFIQRLKLCG